VRCDYCSRNNTEEMLRGSDGIYYDSNAEKHYLYVEHFRNEVYRIEVTHCPKCGIHLASLAKSSPEKEDIINHLVRSLIDEEVDIVQMSTESEGEDMVGGHVKTGFKTIQLRLLNRAQHRNFVKRMQS
jgi:hypothetical protein